MQTFTFLESGQKKLHNQKFQIDDNKKNVFGGLPLQSQT